MTTDNFCFYLINRLIQISQTGGQWYSDTSPFSIPCLNKRQPIVLFATRAVNLSAVCLCFIPVFQIYDMKTSIPNPIPLRKMIFSYFVTVAYTIKVIRSYNTIVRYAPNCGVTF
jgi:hypothetical protein